MKKKTLGLILALLMVFSLLPASAFAANVVQSGTCGDNMTWTLDGRLSGRRCHAVRLRQLR